MPRQTRKANKPEDRSIIYKVRYEKSGKPISASEAKKLIYNMKKEHDYQYLSGKFKSSFENYKTYTEGTFLWKNGKDYGESEAIDRVKYLLTGTYNDVLIAGITATLLT